MSFLRDRIVEQNIILHDGGNSHGCATMTCTYFCDHRNFEQTNATVILRGLLSDIFSQRHDLLHHAFTRFKESSPWSYNRLWSILEAVLSDPKTGCMCVIIDALDDCEGKSRLLLLKNFEDYLKSSKNRIVQINIIISSRPSVKLPASIEALSSGILLDQDEVARKETAQDLRTFVFGTMNEFVTEGQFAQRDAVSLANLVVAKAEGSFLWTSLVLENLQSSYYTSFRDASKFLQDCPADLNSRYYASLAKISTRRPLAAKSLQILVAARRPLTVEEFRYALAIADQHQTIEDVKNSLETNIQFFIQKMLDDLIRIDGSTVRLRHHSVKEFLINGLSSNSSFQWGGATQRDPTVFETF